MKGYKYIARDSEGARREGLSQAISSNDVLAWLREQGLTPISIDEMTATQEGRRKRSRKHIKTSELAAFCWQLTTMLEGGIAITVSFDTIAEDVENSQFQYIVEYISDKIKKGTPVSEAMEEFPRVFNRLSRAIILAGETGGNMAEAVQKLANYFDNRDKLARKIKGALAYPIFVCVFIVLIVIFIMAFIIPRFRTIFTDLGGRLPAFTRGFMAFYDFIVHNLIFIVGSVFLFIIFCVLLYRTKKGHYLFSRIVLVLPLFGKLIVQAFVATLCRTMSTLMAAGVSILEVLDILTEMASNDILRAAVVKTRENIVAGANISLSMAGTGFFPNMLVKMVQVGEESGSLPTVLDKTADHYERKVDLTIHTMTILLEPIMIITVGAIVLVVLLAMYLPIFTMSGVVK